MAVRILPNSSIDAETMEFLKQTGQGGVELPKSYSEKLAAKKAVVAETKKEASMEKEAVTKEEQASYWRQYFADAGLEAEYSDWLNILFG